MNDQTLNTRITTRLTDDEKNKLNDIQNELDLPSTSESIRVLIEVIHKKIESRMAAR